MTHGHRARKARSSSDAFLKETVVLYLSRVQHVGLSLYLSRMQYVGLSHSAEGICHTHLFQNLRFIGWCE